MKISISSCMPHKLVFYEMEDKDRMTELGEILFVNCLWGQRDKAEAIAYYIESLGYIKGITK